MAATEKYAYPSPQEAEAILAVASQQNPGPWVEHSQVVGRAAKTIAAACKLDENIAYVLGLLHDIGRYEGVRGLHHAVAGHALLLKKGYTHNARICLTHSFPIKNIAAYMGKNDCSAEESKLIVSTLENAEYDDYDRLVQLCDALCLPQGVTLLEVRLMDVARRHGLNEYTLQKWDAFFALKDYFDKECKTNIYSLFHEEICKICLS